MCANCVSPVSLYKTVSKCVLQFCPQVLLQYALYQASERLPAILPCSGVHIPRNWQHYAVPSTDFGVTCCPAPPADFENLKMKALEGANTEARVQVRLQLRHMQTLQLVAAVPSRCPLVGSTTRFRMRRHNHVLQLQTQPQHHQQRDGSFCRLWLI